MVPQMLNLTEAVNDLAKMLKRIIGEDIFLEYARDKHVPSVHADVSMMEQILLNLVVNARDAMPQGGQLRISTKKLKIGPKHMKSNPEASEGEFICLRVRDTGCSIRPEVLPRIFEPFFTTKEVGQGTGLACSPKINIFGLANPCQGEKITREKRHQFIHEMKS